MNNGREDIDAGVDAILRTLIDTEEEVGGVSVSKNRLVKNRVSRSHRANRKSLKPRVSRNRQLSHHASQRNLKLLASRNRHVSRQQSLLANLSRHVNRSHRVNRNRLANQSLLANRSHRVSQRFMTKLSVTLIWGDPHIQDAKGNNIEDQIEANKNVLLLETADGASITGHTTSFDNPGAQSREGHDITVFDKEVVNLGDGTRVLMQSDGTAYRVDADGKLGEALKDNEVVSSTKDCNDKVTFDAETRSLNFSFTGDDKSTISWCADRQP